MSRHHNEITANDTQVINIPEAAQLAGFSTRHFRKIIQEDRIPTVKILYKSFLTTRDFETWKETHGERRLNAAIHQVGLWVKDLEQETALAALEAEAEFHNM